MISLRMAAVDCDFIKEDPLGWALYFHVRCSRRPFRADIQNLKMPVCLATDSSQQGQI